MPSRVKLPSGAAAKRGGSLVMEGIHHAGVSLPRLIQPLVEIARADQFGRRVLSYLCRKIYAHGIAEHVGAPQVLSLWDLSLGLWCCAETGGRNKTERTVNSRNMTWNDRNYQDAQTVTIKYPSGIASEP